MALKIPFIFFNFFTHRIYGLDKSGYGIAHSIFSQIFSSVSLNLFLYAWSVSFSFCFIIVHIS